MKKGLNKILAALMVLMLVGTAGCGKKEDSASYSGKTKSTQDTTTESKAEYSKNGGGIEAPQSGTVVAATEEKGSLNDSTTDRKVIKTVRKDIETKEFDKAVNFITERTSKEKGYIQSSNTSGGKVSDSNYVGNRYGEFILRIPVDKLNSFLKDVETIGVIMSSSENGDDITAQYFDTEARVKTLKIQEDRLLAILEKSEKLSDVIELEKRLSEVRTEIENLTGTLKRYDNLVALATVTITIREVQEVTELKTKPIGFGEKIVTAFKDSAKTLYEIMKGLVLVIVSVIPFAAVGAVVFIPLRFIVKKYEKPKKTDEKADENKSEE